MELNTSEKIKIILKRKGITMNELSQSYGSRQNLYQRLRRNTWSEKDLRDLADKIGCDLEISFIDRETGEKY